MEKQILNSIERYIEIRETDNDRYILIDIFGGNYGTID